MKVVIRICIVEASRWLQEHPGKSDIPLAGPDRFWKDARNSLDRDLEVEVRAGRSMESSPASWFELLGVDYTMEEVRN
ncbi:MAG: hypothetical protein IT428_12225 [Planctomycetaceae bacterium]|nr:hypothetical protein [Planctomycetaceae bacterium]